MSDSVCLLAGCDSGFGKVTAKRLDELGFEVFATVLDLSGEGARELRRTCSPCLTLLQVDITQPQQVHQALLDTQAKLGLRGMELPLSHMTTHTHALLLKCRSVGLSCCDFKMKQEAKR